MQTQVISDEKIAGTSPVVGTESWASRFVFPNNWAANQYRKVAIVDPDGAWSLARDKAESNPILALGSLLFFLFLVNAILSKNYYAYFHEAQSG